MTTSLDLPHLGVLSGEMETIGTGYQQMVTRSFVYNGCTVVLRTVDRTAYSRIKTRAGLDRFDRKDGKPKPTDGSADLGPAQALELACQWIHETARRR